MVSINPLHVVQLLLSGNSTVSNSLLDGGGLLTPNVFTVFLGLCLVVNRILYIIISLYCLGAVICCHAGHVTIVLFSRRSGAPECRKNKTMVT